MPMLDRIVADVIEIMMSVLLVSNHMLPIPPLSDASFPLAPPADGNAFAMREHSRETGLDQAAAHWKVIVPRRQAPQARQVVRQYRHGLDHKRMRLLWHVQCFAQCIDVLDEQAIAMGLGQMHCEKVSCFGYVGACVGSHMARIAGIASQSTALLVMLAPSIRPRGLDYEASTPLIRLSEFRQPPLVDILQQLPQLLSLWSSQLRNPPRRIE